VASSREWGMGGWWLVVDGGGLLTTPGWAARCRLLAASLGRSDSEARAVRLQCAVYGMYFVLLFGSYRRRASEIETQFMRGEHVPIWNCWRWSILYTPPPGFVLLAR
jgi:hypothetical protein